MSLILIIDDDPDILETGKLILESKNYEVITANNPADGFILTKDKSPDLIILDVMMEEHDDGFFLAQQIRKEGIKTPILMFSSVSHALGIEYGKTDFIPVNEFLEKPVSPDILIEKVNKLLNINKETTNVSA